jgi:hypothetical protein
LEVGSRAGITIGINTKGKTGLKPAEADIKVGGKYSYKFGYAKYIH